MCIMKSRRPNRKEWGTENKGRGGHNYEIYSTETGDDN